MNAFWLSQEDFIKIANWESIENILDNWERIEVVTAKENQVPTVQENEISDVESSQGINIPEVKKECPINPFERVMCENCQ